MDLRPLVENLRALPRFKELLTPLAKGRPVRGALLGAARPLLLAALWQATQRPLFVLTARPEDARHLYEQVAAYLGDTPTVRILPEPDALPFERLASEPTTIHERLTVLAALADSRSAPPLVIASAYAAAAKTIDPKRFRAQTHDVARNAKLEPLSLLRKWSAMGYLTEQAVELPGAVSRRGGIVDIYPPGAPKPVRIEFWGDTVDSLRLFDPQTQLSDGALQSIRVIPASELPPLDPRHFPLPSAGESLPRALGGGKGEGILDFADVSDEAARRLTEDLRKLTEGAPFDAMEFYRGLVNQASALDYLPSNGLLVIEEPSRIRRILDDIDVQGEELRERLYSQGALPKTFPRPQLTTDELIAKARTFAAHLELDPTSDDSLLPFAPAPTYAGRTKVMLSEIRDQLAKGQRSVVVSQQAPRLQELLLEADVLATVATALPKLPEPKALALLHGSLAEGWALPGQDLLLLTDAELFGLAKQRRHVRKRPVQRQAFLSQLQVGDFVVHIDHGIGRFTGMLVRRVGDREREYMSLDYAAGDRLLVPTDQIDRVGPYVGASERPPVLTRLGSQEWAHVKARVKASTAKVARELVALYATRELVGGHAFGPDTPWQQELEASFPYVETPDQLRAIHEVKDDMERAKPMDRVIAGDVGYGKTEVALRAAFKAVMDGKQVAVLVPTTVLAQQHFNTFTQRLSPFPAKVEMLSRFRSAQEQDDIVKALADGTVDICIGTHRLVQKDVAFKNLGLVVIDEEQRFGVAQKERLKQLRKEVDVLSMSATPIPRTLYMALAGVRDMSVMETPPEERLPIKTYVDEWDDHVVREAVLRELDRGGQIFFVHNRVYNISAVAQHLIKLVPEARVIIGHGQMTEHSLEQAMLAFAKGEADVLVSTTIIESGLDMPNVNTLIVDDADRMGLAQLYQLRGRVGRSSNRAYAYFFYRRDKQITETADKRLQTILTATELGAGFKIAMKDLEIRGAGNILGVEQHGHIASVGFDLYVRLLAEAVEELKAGLGQQSSPMTAEAGAALSLPSSGAKGPARPGSASSPSVELPMAAHVPDTYVTDLSTRLALYQRMSGLKEATDVDAFAEELKDRFGPWPESVEDLLFMLKVKLLAQKAGVLSIHQETGEIVIAGDDRTWSGLLGVQRPYGDGVRVGHTRVRLDIKRLGKNWRQVLEKMLTQAAQGAAV